MSPERRPPSTGGRTVRRRKPPRRRRRAGPFLLVLALVVVIAGAGWWRSQRDDVPEDPPAFEDLPGDMGEAAEPAGDRAIVVVFPEWDAGGYVTEQRQISSRDRAGEDLLGIMKALCEGPRISGAVSSLPGGTRALAAFVDPRDQSVVVDFSQELVTGHPGGSAAEVATLTAILRTVALNFPGTGSCTILVDGGPVETLAGHIDMAQAFDPRRWL